MQIEKQRNRMGAAERWLSLAGGGAALFYGLKRRGWTGSALALAGSTYLVRGATGDRHVLEYLGLKAPHGSLPYGFGIKVRQSVTIDKLPEELYRFWRSFTNLPRFMKHVESVRVADDLHSHWVVRAPAGRTVQWDAEITADRPSEMIGWRSVTGSVDHAGSVRFDRAPGGRGTIVRVQLQYSPPGGRIGAVLARLFGENPDWQIHEDLMRFKQLMEAGEIPTTEGQPSGERAPAREIPARREFAERELVEETSVESFPASDPPSWMAGGGLQTT